MIIGDNYGELDTNTGEYRWACDLCGEFVADCRCRKKESLNSDSER